MDISSPALPFTSDPALYDDWEVQVEPLLLPATINSDEVEALHRVQEETAARNKKEGVVIQHRAWKTGDAFCSEAGYLDDTPTRPRSDSRPLISLLSSPPSLRMHSVSSPVTYPPTSSPPAIKCPSATRTTEVRRRKAVGGFLVDEDSEGDDDFVREEPAPKRRMLETQNDGDAAAPKGVTTSVPRPDPLLVEHNEDETAILEASTSVQRNLDQRIDLSEVQDAPNLPFFLNNRPRPIVPDLTVVERDPPSLPSFLGRKPLRSTQALTCSGASVSIKQKRCAGPVPFEQLVAARSTTKAGRATKSYYGIDIHQLVDEASKETEEDKARKSTDVENLAPTVEYPIGKRPRRTLMWTEKYRARNFMELVGDDRTHRQVLRWLKAWDPIVFPNSGKAKPTPSNRPGADEEEKAHRKILLLTGPPGLGKTTLAHVCARQAGYEVMEINASDERSRDVVKNRIRTSVGTESVKIGSTVTSKSGHVQKVAHPLCVVVDEVDGVVGGSGSSGEGGFIKALIDLILLDQKNSSTPGSNPEYTKKKKKGDDFRLMRPLILICNDVYHPSLRPLRHSNFAEIIHIRKPPLDAVVTRMKSVFEKEGVSCESDAVRRLCEATWGVSAAEAKKGREGSGEGDLRGVMVVGEWAAGKLKAAHKKDGPAKLTRKWVEQNMTGDLGPGGGGARGVGRGGTKEVVNRVFLEGAGFPKATKTQPLSEIADTQPKTQLGVAEQVKKAGMDRLREMVDTSGEIDRIVNDIFAEYPNQPFNDDSILSKPDAAYEWLHFHDTCSSRVFSNQDFELMPYLSQPILACHHLFSSPARHQFGGQGEAKKWGEEQEPEIVVPFSGPRADYEAHEAEKENRATISTLQASLDATLLRSFRSHEDISTELLPYLVRMLTPEVKPIIVGGGSDQKGIASVRKEREKAMVKKAVDVMASFGVVFQRGKLDGDFGNRGTQWVYRMEPQLDTLVTYETGASSTPSVAPVRYAVRQVLDQEYQKNIIVRENAARQARYRAGNLEDDVDFAFSHREHKASIAEEETAIGPKRDFFGRIIEEPTPLQEIDGNVEAQGRRKKGKQDVKSENKIWVTFHEGFSNAVRKPITIEDLLRGL